MIGVVKMSVVAAGRKETASIGTMSSAGAARSRGLAPAFVLALSLVTPGWAVAQQTTTGQPGTDGLQASGTGTSTTSLLTPQSSPLTAGAFPSRNDLAPPAALMTPSPDTANQQNGFSANLGLNGEEKWSDNIYSTSNNTKSDFITTVNPNLTVKDKSRYVDLSANYDLAYDRYMDHGSLSGFRHNGLGVLNTELLDNQFFIDTRGSVSEQAINPTAPQAASARASASNQSRIITYSVSPRLEERLGDWALGEALFRHDDTHNQSLQNGSTSTSSTLPTSGLNNSRTETGKIHLRSGEAFSTLQWDYSGEVSQFVQSQNNLDRTTNSLSGEYHLDDEWGLLAMVGDDEIDGEQISRSKFSGPFGNVGVHWSPSPLTSLRVGGGQRYNTGNLFALGNFQIGPMTSIRLSHDLSITTDDLSIADSLNAVQRDVNGNFINPFSGEAANPASSIFTRSTGVFRQRTTNLVIREDRSLDSLVLNTQLAKRDLVSTPVANSSAGSNTTLSATASWTHKMNDLVSATAELGETSVLSSSVSGGKSDQLHGGLEFTYLMNSSLTGRASYRYVDSDPQTGSRVSENFLSVGLRKQF